MISVQSEMSRKEGVLRKRPAGRQSLNSVARRWLLGAFGVIERLNCCNGVLLTFDDGPNPEVTPAVLELLAKYDARAVFFIVGNRISRAPHMLQRILDEGHIIGNHTYRHPLDGIPTMPAYYRDVVECQAVLKSLTGQSPTLFRPPMGSITLGSLLAPRLTGLRTMLWSLDIDDWKLRRESDAVVAGHRLAKEGRPGDIVLLHDDNSCVVKVLETALPRLSERGFILKNAIPSIEGQPRLD